MVVFSFRLEFVACWRHLKEQVTCRPPNRRVWGSLRILLTPGPSAT